MQTNMDWPRSALGLTLGSHVAIPIRYALVLGPWFRSASLRSGAVLAPLVGWFGCASRLAGGGLVRSARSRSSGGLGLWGLGDDLSYSMLQYKGEVSFTYS